MKNSIVFVIIAAVLTFSTALAGDLGLVKVKNDYQAQVVRGIVDRAYTKVDQGYLVLINHEQAAMLNRTGIEYEIVMPDVDPSLAYLVYPSEKPGAVPTNIAGAVEIAQPRFRL